MLGASHGAALAEASVTAIASLFEATEERLVVNKKYLAAGSASGEEKATLNRELTALILALRHTPTRKVEAGV
jgi:hypothetical protein